ncbi:MAG: amidohydrolase family protein [Gemmatimonadota bacterium]
MIIAHGALSVEVRRPWVIRGAGYAKRGGTQSVVPILERHPGLRLWLMHAPGAVEWVDDTIALMQAFENVYAEMSVINSLVPEADHAEVVRLFLEAGLGDRIMFGSENQPLGPIVDRIDAVPFSSAGQKEAIYCGNAARFLGPEEEFCRLPS